MDKNSGPRILVALDYSTEAQCLDLAQQLDPATCRMKVGKELFTSCGPRVVEKLQALGFDVFLDLKFHDIPNTVAKAVKASAELGVWMVNVHASGGVRMMEAAADVLAPYRQRPLLIGVTVLTSMDAEDLRATGINESPEDHVLRLARLTKSSGLDGVVCSAQEAPVLRDTCGSDFTLVTPGIRPAGMYAADQRRVVTPADALAAGSHFLVIGRAITEASDPAAACRAICTECTQ